MRDYKNLFIAFFFFNLVGIFCSRYHQKDENSGGTERDEGGKAWNIFAIGEEFNLRDTLRELLPVKRLP